MDAQSAINKIFARNTTGNPMSVSELHTLANTVDAQVGNSTLLLYSGSIGKITDPVTGYREFKALDFAESDILDKKIC